MKPITTITYTFPSVFIHDSCSSSDYTAGINISNMKHAHKPTTVGLDPNKPRAMIRDSCIYLLEEIKSGLSKCRDENTGGSIKFSGGKLSS